MLASASRFTPSLTLGALTLGTLAATVGLACVPEFDALDPSLGGSGSTGATGNGASSQGGGGSGAAPTCEIHVDGDDCTDDICQGSEPINPQKEPGAACTQDGGKVCDASGDCVGCFDSEHCEAPETCGGGGEDGVCGCIPTTCAALRLTCGTAPSGCGTTLDCNNGALDGDETGIDCGGSADACANRCALGDACDDEDDCAGSSCADGICCSSACAGICKTCAQPGNEGTCQNSPEQAVDPGTCDAPMACTGGGACKLANGQPCANNGQCASGNCGVTVCEP